MSKLTKVHKIEVSQTYMPVYHSIYLNWVTGMTTLKEKEKQNIRDFVQAVYTLCDEEWPADLVRIFINDKYFDFDHCQTLDLKEATEAIKSKAFRTVIEETTRRTFSRQLLAEPVTLVSQTSKTEELVLSQFIDLLASLKKKAKVSENETFYYHSMPITASILFEQVAQNGETFIAIRESLLPYLRFLDLSRISFEGVSIEGKDLSYTNIINLDINKVYRRRATGTNLEGVRLSTETIQNAVLDGANLKGAYPWIEITSTSMAGTEIDETATLLNGGSIVKSAKPTKEENMQIFLHF